MKFFLKIHKTALYLAIEKQNDNLVKSLLSVDDIDVNIPYILKKKIVYKIINQPILYHLRFDNLMTFKTIFFNSISLKIFLMEMFYIILNKISKTNI